MRTNPDIMKKLQYYVDDFLFWLESLEDMFPETVLNEIGFFLVEI